MVALRLPSSGSALLFAAVVAGACGRPAPVTKPPLEASASDAVELRYAGGPLVEELELQLTHTSVGQYLEAELHARAALGLELDGEALRTRWSLQGIDALTLSGTVAPDEDHQARGFLLARGKGLVIGDAYGLIELAATDAEPINVDRLAAMGANAPPAGALLLEVLAEQLRLPRLPTKPLKPGEAFEIEEESETVITSADGELVLPTTTGHRFTLLEIDDSHGARAAELVIASASIAQADGEGEGSTTGARIVIRTDATLLFDLDRGTPLSLQLSRTETFSVGGLEGERSLSLRTRFRDP